MGNIYRQARETAGVTQQHWAEMLGVSTEAVKQYESGGYTPADDVVLAMADISGLQILGTWHLRRKSAIGAGVIPDVERLPLAQAVVQLLTALHNFDSRHHADALLLIAADGRVDAGEEERFREIVRDLGPLIQAAMQIDFCER